jgi:segregation and condensation protein A
MTEQAFTLTLDNFEGPFDLLLQLIGKHKLDITDVALSKVTDEFIAYLRAGGDVWDLEQTSSFLVVAATLLDLKAARLLPGGEPETPDDLALLEARDLLFARLLQYRAFKQIAAWIAERSEEQAKALTRPGFLEPEYAALLPEPVIPGGAARLAKIAERVLSGSEAPTMPVEHLHIPGVSVREQAALLVERLRASPVATFRALVAGAERGVVVARFLALLELYRDGAVGFEQVSPLGELTIRWSGDENWVAHVSDEYDDALPPDAPDAALSPGDAPNAPTRGPEDEEEK